MITKVKSIHFDINGNAFADYELSLAQYTDEIKRHIQEDNGIYTIENNRIQVKCKFSTIIYYFVVTR